MKEDNYPAMTQSQWDSAPFNESEVAEKEFEVTCSQSLSKVTSVFTSNYIPGAEGVDCEPDDEGGYIAVGWHDPDDTSITDWKEEYESCHYTPIQLINLYKETLQKQLESWEGMEDTNEGRREVSRIKHLIEECENWEEDECEIMEA